MPHQLKHVKIETPTDLVSESLTDNLAEVVFKFLLSPETKCLEHYAGIDLLNSQRYDISETMAKAAIKQYRKLVKQNAKPSKS